MHLIVQKNLQDLQHSFELSDCEESKLFEMYCNFCAVSQSYLGRFNPKDITTQEDDAAIDGIAVIVDGELIVSEDDARAIFDSHKSNMPVHLILTQAKSGESFAKVDIANFEMGAMDFLTLSPKMPSGEINLKNISILKVVFDNLKKVSGGRPTIDLFYCTTGNYSEEREIKAAFDILKDRVSGTDYFSSVSVTPLGRSGLLKMWAAVTEKNEARLRLIDYLGMPEMTGIPQSYVALVNASTFVKQVLEGAEGRMRPGIFEENVRSFLGSDNTVNADISQTLSDPARRHLFSVLNNGITVVAPEMTLTPNSKEIDISNYQIINGCQTSHALWECRDNLSDSVNVVVRFIQSPDPDVSMSVIAATNSQTEIKVEAFHGLKVKAKLVQSYFDAKNSEARSEDRVYFERRENEYRSKDYRTSKIYDIREVSRAYAAMFLGLPHNACRYVKTIFDNHAESLFREADHEALYYAATLAAYKYKILLNGNRANARNYNKHKWHVVYLFRYVSHWKVEDISPNSSKAEKYARVIINELIREDRHFEKLFEICHEIIDSIPLPTDDELKRSKYTSDLRKAAQNFLANRGKPRITG